MTDQTLSESLASRYAALSLEQIPPAIVESAKLHALDSIGCLIAGIRLEPGRLAYGLAGGSGRAAVDACASLLGTAAQAPYLDAVQAMASAAHCGELDDIHSGGGVCIGGMIVPPLLAMAEKFGGTGRRFLEALLAGYEITARVALAIRAPSLFTRGWWPSSVCGAFGVAAAGAKFLDWPADKTANALGIASLHAGGMITGGNEGATARHLIFGRAAQNGLASLLAAEQGFTGPKRALEDPRGFCLTLCTEPQWEYLNDTRRYHLPEVAFKPYPCARQLHAAVEALLAIIQQHSIDADAIDEIELAVPTANAGMVSRPVAVRSRAAVLASGKYVMAVTALRGKMDLESFENEFLDSPEVQALMDRVNVKGEVELDRHFPKYWSGRAVVKASAGRSWSKEVIIPKGESGNPMTRDEIEQKFLSLAAPVLGDKKAFGVVGECRDLTERDSLDGLLSALRMD